MRWRCLRITRVPTAGTIVLCAALGGAGLGCGPLSPAPTAPPKSVVSVPTPGASSGSGQHSVHASLARPESARIIVAEQSRAGSRLVLVGEDGVRRVDVTDMQGRATIDAMPAWSPSGRWLAFVSSRGSTTGAWVLWILDLAEGSAVQATRHQGFDAHPVWTPDGKSLVFSSDEAGTHDLYRLDVSTGRAGEPVPGTLMRLTKDAGDEVEPAVSPDGKSLAFVARNGTATHIRVMPLMGGEARDLTVGPDDRTPAWFPDGQRLVVSAKGPGERDPDLWEVDARTGKRRNLAHDETGAELSPVFSADGRYVFATSIYRSEDQARRLSSLVFLDLNQADKGLRVLLDRVPVHRSGVALAPVPLDATLLSRAPAYRPAVESLLRVRFEEERSQPPADDPLGEEERAP